MDEPHTCPGLPSLRITIQEASVLLVIQCLTVDLDLDLTWSWSGRGQVVGHVIIVSYYNLSTSIISSHHYFLLYLLNISMLFFF